MPARAALLLLLLGAAWLAERAGAAPPPRDKHVEHQYKCCKESKVDKFKNAVKINTLEACKLFCKENKYGPAVWRAEGWGCVSDNLMYSCQEVEHSRCDDMVEAAQNGLYRMYALSSSFTDEVTVIRGRRINQRSVVGLGVDTTDDFSGRVAGGDRTGVRSRRGNRRTTILNTGRVESDTLRMRGRALRSANHDMSSNLFDLGDRGSAVFVRRRQRRGVTRFTDQTSDFTDGTRERRNQDINLGESGKLQTGELAVGRVRTEERNIQNNTNNATLESTSVDAKGTAKIKVDNLVNPNMVISTPNGPARRATRTVGSSVNAGVGAVDRFTTFSLTTTGRTTHRGNNDRTRSTETVDKTSGDQETLANSSRFINGTTDRTRVESDVGTIDSINNRTSGAASNRTEILRREGGTQEISKTSDCPGCKAQNKEFVERDTERLDNLKATSRFNRTGTLTETKVKDGKSLKLVGVLGTSTNGTVLHRKERGKERRKHDGKSRVGCKKGSKDCDFSSSSSGVTFVNSVNDSTIEEDVIVKTKKLSSASFRL